LDLVRAVPVLPLLAETAPVALAALLLGPSEAFCGVETWVLRRGGQCPDIHAESCATKGHAMSAAQQRAHGEKLLEFAEDDEGALREIPGERVHGGRCWIAKMLDSRRPLGPGRWPQEFAAGSTLHPADPPLEPQGGRLHNLLKHCQDEPESTQTDC
jgi:hypothetical protein